MLCSAFHYQKVFELRVLQTAEGGVRHLQELIGKKISSKKIWQGSLLHSMIFISNCKAFVQ